MKACYTREIINPILPCKMEGYNEARFCFHQTQEQKNASKEGLRTAYGQRDDLLLDTICFQENQMIVFYQLDICIVESEFVMYCKDVLMKNFTINAEQISIACSHTHNSPVVSHGMAYDLEPNLEYWEMIAQKMVISLQYCLHHLEDVKMQLDQFKIEGFYNNRNRPNEEYYDKCDALNITSINGKPILRILNLACHPTILGAQNMLITADFFGVMRRYLQGLDGIPVMMFNGEAGDSSPRLLKRGVDWTECIRYGEGIGKQCAEPNHPLHFDTKEITITTVPFKIDYNPKENKYLLEKLKELKKKLETEVPHSDYYERIKTCYLYDVEEKLKKEHIAYDTLNYIYDFGSFRIVCVPCEIDTVLGKRIREADSKPTLLCAYSNGFHYYAVNKQEYGEVFESFNTYYAYGDADRMVDEIIKNFK